MSLTLTQVAVFRCDLPTKFGIPRQSGLSQTEGRVCFLPAFRDPVALRGLEGFSHIWLLWGFSLNRPAKPSLTVRPPRLGGNERVGVFASRSPFRPSPVGLSSVRIIRIEQEPEQGSVIVVGGADLADGTPIYDIKPYLPFTDCHPDATGGFAEAVADRQLEVDLPPQLRRLLPPEKAETLCNLLAQDPRPGYQDDPTRIYGLPYAGFDVRFSVMDGVVRVLSMVQDTQP